MTTAYLNTTGIPLYTFNGETYCKMLDVLHIIHHETLEADSKSLRCVLDRMEMRVARNSLLLPDSEDPSPLQPDEIPGRYAVGIKEKSGNYIFITDTGKDGVKLSIDLKQAKRYVNYRDAAACADFFSEDFTDEDENCPVDVIDCESLLTEEQRWLRNLLIPFPFDADDGNDQAIPAEILT